MNMAEKYFHFFNMIDYLLTIMKYEKTFLLVAIIFRSHITQRISRICQ